MDPTPGPVQVVSGYGLAAAPADGSALAWSTVVDWLTWGRNYWVCTARMDGRPHVMPVWALWLDGCVWFSTDPASRKARNLRANPEAVVHLESGDEVYVLEGVVRRVDGEAAPSDFVAEYARKYGVEIDLSDPNFGLYVLEPRVALTWTEAEFPTTATRWTF